MRKFVRPVGMEWVFVGLSFLFVAIGAYNLWTSGTTNGFFVGGAVEGWLLSGPDTIYRFVMSWFVGFAILSGFMFFVCIALGSVVLAIVAGIYVAGSIGMLFLSLLPSGMRQEIKREFQKEGPEKKEI